MTTTIRTLVDQLTDTAKMIGWDSPVLVEVDRGDDLETPLEVTGVDATFGDQDDDPPLPDAAILSTQEQGEE